MNRRNLIIPGTDKGGTGKSRCLVEMASWLTNRHPEVSWRGIDPDITNHTFVDHFPAKVTALDLDRDSPDVIYDTIQQTDVMLVDGAGSRQTTTFVPWMAATSISEVLGELECDLTFMVIVSQNRETVEGAVQFLHTLKKNPAARFLIIRSTLGGFDLPAWDSSAIRAELKESGRSLEIYAPAINEFLIEKWPHNLLTPLFEASDAKDDAGAFRWQMYDRQRLRNHARIWWIEWRKARSFILPASVLAASNEYDGGLGLENREAEADFLMQFRDTRAAFESLKA